MKFTSLLFSFLTLISSSCRAPSDDESALSVIVGPNPTFALPIAQTTCKQEAEHDTDAPALSAPTFELGTFKVKWSGANKLRISYIEVILRHGSLDEGSFKCIIAGSEMAAINSRLALEIAPNAEQIEASLCGIRCGGLAFRSNVTYAYIPGTLRIFAVEYDAENVGTPVVTEADIAVEKKF